MSHPAHQQSKGVAESPRSQLLSDANRKRRKVVVFVAVCVAGCMLMMSLDSPSPDDQLKDLRRHFVRRDYEDVVALAETLKHSGNLSDRVMLMAGEAATKTEQYDKAVDFYGLVTEASDKYVVAQIAIGEVLREQYDVSGAERAYEAAVAHRPDNATAHSRLALLAMCTGRPFKARRHLKVLLKHKTISWSELCWLAAPERGARLQGYFEHALKLNSSDELAILGAAESLIRRGEFDQCRELFADTPLPHSARISAARLKCGLLGGRCPDVPGNLREQFGEFQSPDRSDALFWLGTTLEENDYPHDAISCFANCLQRGEHLPASQHLLTLLKAQNRLTQLSPLQERVELLGRVAAILDSVNPDVVNSVAALELAGVMTKLGRHDEAIAWFAAAGHPETNTSQQGSGDTSIQPIVDACLREQAELSATIVAAPVESDSAASEDLMVVSAAPLFTDIASNVGISFQYFESPDGLTEGRRMFEFTGGGVGVLDIDNDSWPDLHFAQGTNWPVSESNRRWKDVLYRNIHGEAANDVSASSGIIEANFSQGVCCGDLNNDGFTDLVVANIGKNSYWLNQGDGTFQRLRQEVPTADLWTSSCAIADMNADGLSDIFEVNYVSGPEAYTRICDTPAGPRVCSPQAFRPTSDRLLLNLGDGRFADVSAASGLDQQGNGLGLIVADLDSDPMPEIFVANDATPNFLWDIVSTDNGVPRFREVASERGVALSSEGRAQACMGIAVGDYNSDGNSDLFVTNYFNEANALYLFDSIGFASDRSVRSNVRRTSMKMLGFGCQTITTNEHEDVFVVNGDIDDFSHEGRSLKMRPQFLVNDPNRESFREARSKSSDCLLNSTFRGRAVAKCDWDRDGEWELVVTCLGEPAKLLECHCSPDGKRRIMTVVGTTRCRQPVTATVTDTRGVSRKVTVGGGYMASNQIGHQLRPDETVVTTKTTSKSRMASAKMPVHHFIVEGRPESYWIPP